MIDSKDNDFNFQGADEYPLLSSEFINAVDNWKEGGRTVSAYRDRILQALGMDWQQISDREMFEGHRRMQFTIGIPLLVPEGEDGQEQYDALGKWLSEVLRTEWDHEVHARVGNMRCKDSGGRLRNWRGPMDRQFAGQSYVALIGMGYVHQNRANAIGDRADCPDFVESDPEKYLTSLEILNPREIRERE